jgi:hypothetical protein
VLRQTTIPAAGVTTLRYYVVLTGYLPNLPIIKIPLTNFAVKDVGNQMGSGLTISLTFATTDSASLVPFDTVNTVDLMTGTYGVTISNSLLPGAAVVDTQNGRLLFVANLPNVTTLQDGSASLGIKTAASDVFVNGCTTYALTALSSIQLRIAGNFAGVTSISFVGVTTTAPVGGFTGSVTLLIPGNNASLAAGTTSRVLITTTTANTTQLYAPQVFTVEVNALYVAADGLTSPRNLVASNSTLTSWTLNGTTLISLFQNGNNAFLFGRMYIWNASSQSGTISAIVYTLPTTAGTPSAVLGTLNNFATIGATAGLNIRLAEDILTPLGVTLPYTTNAGNLVVVLNITASNCSGWSNVFSSAISYGVNTMVGSPGN